MTTYSVRYKGHVEREGLTEHALIELVNAGQISGVHDYSADGTSWHPVYRIEYQRADSGDWKLAATLQRLAEAQRAAGSHISIEQPVAHEPVHSPARSESQPGIRSDASPPSTVPGSGQVAAMPAGWRVGVAIAGFVSSVVALLLGLTLLIPPLFHPATGIAGTIIAVTSVVVSGFGMFPNPRRPFAIAGLAIGVLAMVGWSVALAVILIRGAAR